MVFCGGVQPIIRLDIGRYFLPWRHEAPYVRPPRSPTSTRLLLPSTSRPSSASLVARRCTTRTSPLSSQPGTPMKAAVPTWRNPTEDYGPASSPSSNACRPGKGGPASTRWVSGLFLAVLAFLLLRKLCQPPCGQPPGTHQARCRSRAHQWTVRSQQGFVARGSEEKKNRPTPGRGEPGWAM
jgi:hypothetical protein